MPAECTLIGFVDALAYFFPGDLIYFFATYFFEIVVVAVISAKGIDGIRHGVNVPIVGLDAIGEDFGASALFTDDAGYAALHGFERTDTKWFAHAGHDVHIAFAEGFEDLMAFHEAWEVELVGNAFLGYEVNHLVHLVAATCHAETDAFGAIEYFGCCFNEVLWSFLHGDASEEGYYLVALGFVFDGDVNEFFDFGVERIDGVVHGDALGGVLVVVVDDCLACEFTDAHDTVGVVHAVFFDAIDGGIYFAS